MKRQIETLGFMRNRPVITDLNISFSQKKNMVWDEYNRKYKDKVSDWNFFWERSERMIFFVWMRLKNRRYFYDNDRKDTRPYFELFNLPEETKDSEHRKDIIRRYLIIMSFVMDIQLLLGELRREWNHIVEMNLDIGNIKNVESNLELWLWDQFQRIKKEWLRSYYDRPQWTLQYITDELKGQTNHVDSPPSRPIERKELLNWIQGEIDIAGLSDAKNKIVRQKLGAAYSNKIFQLKKNKLKPLNTHLDEGTLQELKKLQMHFGFNKADMLTYLISDSYRKNCKVKA